MRLWTKVIIILVLLLSVFLWLYHYLFTTQVLKIEFVEYHISRREEWGLGWLLITPYNASTIAELDNIDFSSIDFKKNYAVVSYGRQIKEIRYQRISRFLWPLKAYKGDVVFKKQLEADKIFIYKAQRVNCIQDHLGVPIIIFED